MKRPSTNPISPQGAGASADADRAAHERSQSSLSSPSGEHPLRVERIGRATLYLGDCRDILPTLAGIDAIISDPPYGMKANTDYTRFSAGSEKSRRKRGAGGKHPPVLGDDQPFDPAHLLGYDQIILWGLNHFNDRLPRGGGLVWLKRNPEAFGSFLSDAELGWEKGKTGVACFLSYPQAMAHFREHPTQKPVDLMEWCVVRTRGTICDPYMGSGSTGVAAMKAGRPFVGIEAVPEYFELACRRVREASGEDVGPLFGAAA